MKYSFDKIQQEYINEIAYKWKYKGKYSFYTISKEQSDLELFLTPTSWQNIFAVTLPVKEQIKLVGFTTYNFENGIMWIGFGMKPNYTGKGLGESFVRSAIEFGVQYYNYQEHKILLSVAEFNKRAIKVYAKVGFKTIEQKECLINGKNYSFRTMGLSI